MKKVSKDQAAVALGNRGGKARGTILSPERRSEIARMGGLARTKSVPPKSTPSKAPAHFRTARLPMGMSTLINKRPTICVVGTITNKSGVYPD